MGRGFDWKIGSVENCNTLRNPFCRAAQACVVRLSVHGLPIRPSRADLPSHLPIRRQTAQALTANHRR
jgi:hypothetical protein